MFSCLYPLTVVPLTYPFVTHSLSFYEVQHVGPRYCELTVKLRQNSALKSI